MKSFIVDNPPLSFGDWESKVLASAAAAAADWYSIIVKVKVKITIIDNLENDTTICI
jgi:hypothetical protein